VKTEEINYGNREEVLEALESLFRGNDTEMCHVEADDVLCGLLRHLGYEDVTRIYEKIDKWYA